MYRIEDKQSLIELFRELEQPEVLIPHRFSFPLGLSDSLSWMDPSGHRSFLVYKNDKMERPLGLVFRKAQTSHNQPAMCHWCHAVRPQVDVTLMTVKISQDHSIGLYLCSDLNCRERLLENPSPSDLRETLSRQDKQFRLNQKIENFIFHQVL